MKRIDRLKNPCVGFSLLELLIVIAIISILVVMARPAITGFQQSLSLTTAGKAVEAELTTARETAQIRRRPVEVRFYQYNRNGTNAFHSLQSWALTENGTYTPLGKLVTLPSGIIISGDSQYSKLLTESSFTSEISQSGYTKTRAFQFLATGSTDMDSAVRAPYLTLLPATLEDPREGNYFTIQINSETGKLRSFRP